jgi:hypothetical protein
VNSGGTVGVLAASRYPCAYSERSTDMASNHKRKTTMAKRDRERRLIERRLEKQARKEARKHAAAERANQVTDI